MKTRLTAHERRQVTVRAVCCEHTVRAYELGRSIRDGSRVRIEAALRELGIELHAPANTVDVVAKAS